ncbi:tyrosine-type recombinase/integrase [Shinella pollutisoli]|uniref:Tyrosine-type recombinase/integrase n=1 Tax=Shinella pollutisoli TaxID=2250594 RepID=A0ABV7DH21_9HYPH|nr:site-specific integrase [Shinella pollutisoli]
MLNKLTPLAVKNAPVGRHGDGGGLYLLVRPDGRRSWLLRFVLNGRQRDMGLGTAAGPDAVSLKDARSAAAEARKLLDAGIDPIVMRGKKLEEAKADLEKPTFEAFAKDFIDTKATALRNEKHIDQWRMTVGPAYCKGIQKKRLDEIDTEDALAILSPIWTVKSETAARIRGRLEAILDAAKAKGLRSGENPFRLRGHIEFLLPKRNRLQRGHHAAMDYKAVPAFWPKLDALDSLSAQALKFTILTAARSGETRGATWGEIDLDEKLWTVPKERMKAGREHQVPLSDEAVAILRKVLPLAPQGAERGKALVFPSRKRTPLSDMSLAMCLRGRVEGITVHGFRSTFRDWCGDMTTYPREVAEAALAHTLRGVEGAYRRGAALEKRRALMSDWAAYVTGTQARNVLQFQRSA